ncbi:hypothetical protein [Herbaspirillum robiniae]|uniref:hypothetical protein n=1 Tax=Herbaspirillum robiniae TaxID=2014887 RepID=UPI003D77B59B
MNALTDHAPGSFALEKLSGRISNYRETRAYASFVFSDKDRSRMAIRTRPVFFRPA